jgi:hypothetical protein
MKTEIKCNSCRKTLSWEKTAYPYGMKGQFDFMQVKRGGG